MTSSHDKTLLGQTWLSNVSKQAITWQVSIFSLQLCQLFSQIAAFWFFAKLAQSIVVEQQTVELASAIPFIAASSCWALLAYFANLLGYRAKTTLEQDIEEKVLALLQTRQLALTRQYSSTFWQQLLVRNLDEIGQFVTQYSVQKWLASMAPLVVILVILPVNYVVAIALVVTMPVVPLFMIIVGKGAANLNRKHFVALERLGDMFSDRLKGLTLITSTGQHAKQVERLQSASNIVNRKTMNVVAVAFLSSTVLDFFATVSMALVAVFIGFSMLGELAIGPSINLHQGLFMLLVAPLLFAELKSLGKLYHQKAKAVASAEYFGEVFEHTPHSGLAEHSGEFTQEHWLNFHMENPRIQAQPLSFSKGDWILLTGKSGSGKTAFLEALMGFRNASHNLPGSLALLSQQTCVLNNTLAFNLHLGNSQISEREMITALQQVELDTWYQQLPDGLATQMGDYAALSGGEAQRLALARVLLLDRDIILLDEPTAHLTDSQQQNLTNLIHAKLANKTVIWVSHKQLPISWFNKHWTIDSGELQVSTL